MLEANRALLFVLLYVGLDGNHVLCDEVLSFVLGLIQVEDELGVSAAAEVGNEEVYWAFGHHHDMLSVNVFKVGLDWQFGLVELLLSWLR